MEGRGLEDRWNEWVGRWVAVIRKHHTASLSKRFKSEKAWVAKFSSFLSPVTIWSLVIREQAIHLITFVIALALLTGPNSRILRWVQWASFCVFFLPKYSEPSSHTVWILQWEVTCPLALSWGLRLRREAPDWPQGLFTDGQAEEVRCWEWWVRSQWSAFRAGSQRE